MKADRKLNPWSLAHEIDESETTIRIQMNYAEAAAMRSCRAPDTADNDMPPHQNLWVNPGSGRAPRL